MAFVYLLGNLWGMGERMDALVLMLAVCVYFVSTHTEWRRWKRRLFRIGIAVFLFLLAAEHAENEIEYKDQYLSQMTEQMPVTVQGTLYKKEYKNKQYLYYLTDCYAVISKGTISTNDVIAYLQTDDYSIGQILIIHAKVKMFDEARNEGNFDLASFYAGQKIDYALKSCRIDQVYGKADRYREGLYQLQKRMERIFKEYLSKREAGTISGMILGDKSEMDQEVRQLYQNGGISHILAISGVKTLKLDIPLVPETRINWAFVPLHIAIIYILKLCLDEEIIPRCRFPCSRGYLTKCINWQKKQ